eukprot:5661657-Prorocentrum_lima.AAC.1
MADGRVAQPARHRQQEAASATFVAHGDNTAQTHGELFARDADMEGWDDEAPLLLGPPSAGQQTPCTAWGGARSVDG